MMNLLPGHAKRTVAIEYVVRLLTVVCVATGTLLLLYALAQLPKFVLLQVQMQGLSEVKNAMSSEEEQFEANSSYLREANASVRALQKVTDVTPLMPMVESVLAYSSPSISIATVSISRPGTLEAPTELILQGNAATREALVSFRDELEAVVEYEAVELPLSNLVKETDVSFLITITLAEPTS